MERPECVDVYTDGATVGHNGKLGTVKEVGVGIYIPDLKFKHAQRLLGKSNNEAEFKALIMAMQYVADQGIVCANFYLDSQIVVNRAKRGYIKVPKKKKHINERMDKFQTFVMNLASSFEHITFNWIPREENTIADELSKKATTFPSLLKD